MAEKDSNALVVRAASVLQATGQGPKGILSGMVVDALALARHSGKELVAARFPLGGYEFCEPDYRQILLWAQALGLEPEEVICRLQKDSYDYRGRESLGFKVTNGAIVTLNWDFELLPLETFKWLDGLVIQEIRFEGNSADGVKISLENLPLLSRLEVSSLDLTKFNLSKVPSLTHFECNVTKLTQLDLSLVPRLIYLQCVGNQLTELDLSPVPALIHLECSSNQLTELDVSPMPSLTELWCDDNQLTKLDLSSVTCLTELVCSDNHLTELDLLLVPSLTALVCDSNQLTNLDLSPVTALTDLDCRRNQLTNLEIRHLSKLTEFYADSTVTVQKRPDQKNIHV